ncbi:RNA polymerase II elongation factor ELL Eleven-nineteen lysine-rich leukemia protein [Channa argus]|uniref:RNA polymerase II elongation factor ELL Eleven-nineteen lysine-rich leukemia protein n=1 Tax=Channa argus TaxID=215402 RepID=A0A6G1QF34_CHAAH|nr:RNA polymerase II elongation factor ELL Eleven-nineteen lysine-rich leukemia protein [Channa argus]
MSALRESQCYGLSSGKLSRGGNVSVFHVKLTDSAARAIGTFQNSKRITIPSSENRAEVRIFTFGVTNVAGDNPHGSFDCVQQLSKGAAEELSCLGVIQQKMTVNATDDSYDKARQSMAQAEEETRSRGTIVIKHGGRYQGKKVTVRAPAPALASLTKPKHSSQSLLSNIRKGVGMSKVKKSACVSTRECVGDVKERPLKERVTHLLALRPYKKPELILRLQKDELSAGDKDMLDSVLTEVGQLNSRDNTFVLKDSLYKELQKDWPGYTPGDQQLLKRILVRRLFQPQQNLHAVPEAQVSPLRDTPNSSPAHCPKHSLQEEYTDPLSSKKPRVSRLPNKTVSDTSRFRPSEQLAHKDVTETTADDRQNISLDPRKLLYSLSAVCQQEEDAAKRLQPTHAAQKEPKSPKDRPRGTFDQPPLPLITSDQNNHTAKRKKSKHKHRDQEKNTWRDRKERRKDHNSENPNKKDLLDCSEPRDILFDANMMQTNNDTADYLLKYTVICSSDQRQCYKQDFNKEYKEYRELHARIDSVTQQFMELDTQLKQLHHKSHKYKSNPNYNQDKIRCEYLHKKLAHIKKLISEYDQQQLSVDHS